MTSITKATNSLVPRFLFDFLINKLYSCVDVLKYRLIHEGVKNLRTKICYQHPSPFLTNV